MHKILVSLALLTPLSCTSDEIMRTMEAISSGQGPDGRNAPLSNLEIVSGLKEALKVGSSHAAKDLHVKNAFLGNSLIKIAFPPEAKVVYNTLNDLGFSSLTKKVVVSLNRAAEDAAIKAKPIFITAITSMTFADAAKILRGADNAATQYLQKTTSMQLTKAFRPVIKRSLNKVDATKYWGQIMRRYNRIPLVDKINPDLTGYVTQKALDGLFHQVSTEEKKIRRDPAARVSEILRRVFSS